MFASSSQAQPKGLGGLPAKLCGAIELFGGIFGIFKMQANRHAVLMMSVLMRLGRGLSRMNDINAMKYLY
jgi:hypothetical protein